MNKRILYRILIGIFLNFILVSLSSAANFYVRSGANGANNGSDWANAWKQMKDINYSVINPGDTIYIAAGTYGALSIDKSGTPGNPITFKRATTGSHGSSTGWASNYDGQVIIDGGDSLGAIGIGEGSGRGQSHITIDGVTRYGIKVQNASVGVRAVRGPSDNITLRYLDIGDSGSYKMGEDGIQGRGSNLLVEYSYIHDNDSLETHGDGIQWFAGNNIVVRYSVFKNNGQIMMLTETAWGNDYVNDLKVYYNVFYNRGGTHYNGISKKLCPQSGSWNIYNNTFDLEATNNNGMNNLLSGAGSCSRMDFKNNAVIYSNASSTGDISHSYNAYDNSGQYSVHYVPSETGQVATADLGFVNVDSADYHLTSSSPLIGKGVNVGLSTDFDGKPVPTNPTIGAFESGKSSSTTTTSALLPPTNLRVQ
ncbi:hypothetical protein [Methylobacter sp. BlB1]|uniref:hypothetical protein n=1 Tax=Methylobacter sp. BlB1 TaxID=2785914 RepID=UPI0018943BEC|nr:hypothetical protein [Methylobacter sp. BlB1]MBF6651119.1 hypothetical protein [Methylobacter sp. BlB1]